MSDDPRPPTLPTDLVERLLTKDLEAPTGPRLSRRAVQTQRSVEAYLNAGVRPRWMERLMEIERGVRSVEEQLAAEYRALDEACGSDRGAFAERWCAVARARRFDALNELIRQHNDWYPIERDLPMDPRTGDYVLISGRSYRRPELTAAWVLERFPAG